MDYNMLLGYLDSIKSGMPLSNCNCDCNFCSYSIVNNGYGVLCGELTKNNVRDIACKKVGIRSLSNE